MMNIYSFLRIYLSLVIFGIVHSAINQVDIRNIRVVKEYRPTGKGHRITRAAIFNNNEATVLGHRNPLQNPSISSGLNDFEKRGWNDNTMAVWGKRSEQTANDRFAKRKWGDNSMQVWGKRSIGQLEKLMDDDGSNDYDPAGRLNKAKLSSDVNLIGSKLNPTMRNKPSHILQDDSLLDSGEIFKRKWGDNSMSVWGKRSERDDKRKWGDNSMSVWGKRGDEDKKRKWGDNNMSVWGKRNEKTEKRKWGDNSMSVWGKRSSDGEKRKWGDNSMAVWGKRNGGEDNTKDSSEESLEEALKDDKKRKWGDNSMLVWGKRATEEEDKRSWKDSLKSSRVKRFVGNSIRPLEENSMSLSDNKADFTEKRKWGDNSMLVWGKRANSDAKHRWEDNALEAVLRKQMGGSKKRKWGDNSMSVWGKRTELVSKEKVDESALTTDDKKSDSTMPSIDSTDTELVQSLASSKRKWGDNSMSTWGKRADENVNSSVAVEVKRKWGNDAMNVWGKRTGADDDTEQEITRETKAAPSHVHTLSKRSLVDSEKDEENRIAEENFGKYLANQGYGQFENYSPKRNWETNTMRVWGKRNWKHGSRTPTRRMRSNAPLTRYASYVPLWTSPSRAVTGDTPVISTYVFDELADKPEANDDYIAGGESEDDPRSLDNNVLAWE